MTLLAAPRGAAQSAPACCMLLLAMRTPREHKRYRSSLSVTVCNAAHAIRSCPNSTRSATFFRNHGYRLPIPKHGTTLVAIRYQMEYDKDRRAERGTFRSRRRTALECRYRQDHRVSALQSRRAGRALRNILAYLATYNEATQMQYRFGLFELPLIHSPGQRLDDLAPYGYEQTHVGLDDLTLAQPRWGLEAERQAAARGWPPRSPSRNSKAPRTADGRSIPAS